jgi:molybdenum-dependent DNA-binding transcriptional regulator ModE
MGTMLSEHVVVERERGGGQAGKQLAIPKQILKEYRESL